ncbi:MAG: hypothetical protein AAF432_06495 [Planctomycetota bacterium]
MRTKLQTIDRRLLMRQCVACGYDGALLRGGAATRCARCGCDLRRRPARSYAEMEGLLGRPVMIDTSYLTPARETAIVQKWIAVFFVMTIAMISFLYLVASAVPA